MTPPAGSLIALLLFTGTGEERLRAKVPQFSPAPGTFTASVTVSVSTYSTGARIYCTSDGSTPRPQASLLYTAPLTFGATTTLKCRTYRSDREPSLITSGLYTVTPSGGYQSPLAAYTAATTLCANLPLRTTGHAVHYFCACGTGAEAGCVAGSDANNGLSTSTPKQTWAQAVSTFNAMPAGDTVAFCKGGGWSISADAHFHNANCTATSGADLTNDANAASACDLRDYSPTTFTGTNKPRFTSSTTYPWGWWTNGSADRGVRIMNLDIRGTGATGTTRGIYMEPDQPMTDWLICNNTIRDVFIGVYDTPFYNYLSQDIRILANDFYLNGLDSFLGGGLNTWFEANYILDSGFYAGSGNPHAIYAQGQGATFTIKNNRTIYSTAHPCGYSGMLAHHAIDAILIENNYFDGSTSASGNCWAFSFASGAYSGVAEHLNNMVLRGNWIQNFGYYGMYIGMAPDVVVENNVLVQTVSNGTTGGITISDGFNNADDAVTTRAILRNNTVYFAAGSPGGEAAAISLGNTGSAPGTGHVVANNTVYLAAGGTCYGTYVGNANIAFMNNNQCYGGSYWEKDNAGSRSLATWRTYSGFDGVSITTAPLYTNPPTDFMPQAGSPLINAGSNTYKASIDFFGNTRSSPPDIGAVER